MKTWPSERQIVTMCGSMRFFPQMMQVAAELTLRGQIVIAPFAVVAPEKQSSREKSLLDQLHFDKIRMSDVVVVVTDPEGYYGESTAREIDFAIGRGMGVTFRPVEV